MMTFFKHTDYAMLSRYIKACLAILLLQISLVATAQNSDVTASSPFPIIQDEFLNVDEAYVTSAKREGQNVYFNWKIADNYYLYKHRLSLHIKTATGLTELEFTAPDGLKKFDEVFQETLEVYYNTLTVSAVLPDEFTSKTAYELVLGWQGCADAGLCYEPQEQFFAPVSSTLSKLTDSAIQIDNTSPPTQVNTAAPESNVFLPLILLGAMLGGMILNLMPCVFPVLSLKALSLTGDNAQQHKINGWAYTAGVVLSFMVVAAIMLIAKSAGTSLGWGFQLQQPAFVAALIYLFFLLALNLFGVFEIGTGWMGVGNSLTQGHGANASFFTGVLAAVVASPCTAPFMASAIGFTLSQNAFVSMSVFMAIGFGMALPYLLLSHMPALAARLPRPGPWMDTFKQFLAFPLLFTCVWLLVVIGNQTSAYASALIVGGTIALAMAIWLWQKQPSSNAKWGVRALSIVLAVAALNLAYSIDKNDTETELWQVYSPELLTMLQKQNQAVFIDLTADWCITCKINERVALNTDEVMSFARSNDIAMLRGDWTNSDPQITELLHRFNRNGVPLYIMYSRHSNQEPEVLPQLLTKSSVLDAMKRAVNQP